MTEPKPTKNILIYPNGILVWNDKRFRCAIGKNSVTENKREGDMATPLGCFPIREILYRKDKIQKPKTLFPVSEITPDDGWCDDINSPEYNKKIKLPFPSSHENLWREDDVYDCIVILGYNDNPPEPGKGSAIFMHVARESYSPTAGCIALSLDNLLALLKEIPLDTTVCVQKEPLNR